ncbi:Histone-lysine N-methyltransferase EZ3 [Glycine soja]
MHKKQHGEAEKDTVGRTLKIKIKQLTDQINVKRGKSVKEKVERHWNNLKSLFSMVELEISRRESLQTKEKVNMLSSRIGKPLSKFNGFPKDMIEKDRINNADLSLTKTIRIPKKEKIPPYTSWVYVVRNERMAKDQTVLGKYQMYYDKNRGEMMICSDSEEEMVNPKDVKHDFTEAEDQILWTTLAEYGSTEEIFSIVKEIVKTTDSQIQERYEILNKKNMRSPSQNFEDCHCRGCQNHLGICLEENLNVILEPFDNFFCRRCLIFDCSVHGIYQPLIYHSEKQSIWSELEGDKKPCSKQCYIMLKDVNILSKNTSQRYFRDKIITPMEEDPTLPHDEPQDSSKRLRTPNDIITEIDLRYMELNLDANDEENHTTYGASLKSLNEHSSGKSTVFYNYSHDEQGKGVMDGEKDLTNEIEFNQLSISREVQAYEMTNESNWRPLERDLYLKGVEMFGKNSCLIAFNLLHGLKTCIEVTKYMSACDETITHGSIPSSTVDKKEKINAEFTKASNYVDFESETIFCYRTKKWLQDHGRNEKRANQESLIILENLLAFHLDGEKLLMGKINIISNILLVGVRECVERNVLVFFMELAVKNIVGVQSFATTDLEDVVVLRVNAEVDNAHVLQPTANVTQMFVEIVGCGDGSLGEPPRCGDGKCGNMNLLLGLKERILLAKSDVIGWGAFAKNPINKNVCLGEYTGELITPKEAEKRGKLYDRINTSFLFNLNDRWVIDSCRLGDKLKFANHSSKPNCYAKVMLVGGEHRVGIFSKENIEAGEEIFYDYWYDLDCAPQWALPPDEVSKKDESIVSQGRAKKNQSHC